MKTKIRVFGAAILTIAVLILLAVNVVYAICDRAFNRDGQYQTTRPYTVQQGDTIWGIAERYVLPSVDKREWVNKVLALNPALRMQPGEVIYIYTSEQTSGQNGGLAE